MGKGLMQPAVVKRSIVVRGHKTGVTLEDAFWSALRQIAQDEDSTLGALVGKIDSERDAPNLSSAIRVYILEYFKALHEKQSGR
jgi:predicted DNA-binding ribbon-helix-helix protein